MKDFATVLFYIALGFLSGSIFYCRLLPMLLMHRDVCALSPDKNPGAANVFVHCGVPMGLLCLALDMAKGALPVVLALRVIDPARLAFAAVMAAPTRTPINRLAVRRSSRIFIFAPAAASRPELVICIP